MISIDYEAVERGVSIASGMATIAAAVVAIFGITAWRRQLAGATQYKLAVRVYRAVLRLRDRIRSTRDEMNHMLILTREERDNPKLLQKREYEKYSEWFREVVRAALALRALRPEVELHWGLDAARRLDELNEMARKLRGGQWAYFHHRWAALEGESGLESTIVHDRTIAFAPLGEDPDQFGEELDRRLAGVEAWLRPKLTR